MKCRPGRVENHVYVSHSQVLCSSDTVFNDRKDPISSASFRGKDYGSGFSTTSIRPLPRQVFVMLCFMVNELGKDDSIKLKVLLIPHSDPLKFFPLHWPFKKPLDGYSDSDRAGLASVDPMSHTEPKPRTKQVGVKQLTLSWVLLIWILQGPKTVFNFRFKYAITESLLFPLQEKLPFIFSQAAANQRLSKPQCLPCLLLAARSCDWGWPWQSSGRDKHNIYTYYDRQFDTPSQLAQHDVAKHNMCMNCRQYFNTPANLNSVCLFISHLDVKNIWLKSF